MDNIEPGKTFVRYVPEKDGSQSYLAVVTGILGSNGEDLTICFTSRRGGRTVRRNECITVLPTIIQSGLIHFNAYAPCFGAGVVASEEMIDGLLYVELYRDGEYSELLPITEVTFCCS
jgi:hypothetical protein